MSSIVGQLDKKLYFGPTFLRGIVYIIAVAILITIFELVFYAVHIAPMENENIKYKINNGNNNFFGSNNNNNNKIDIVAEELITAVKSKISPYVNTVSERESKLNKKINNDAITFICIEIFILLLIIFIVYQKLKTYVTSDLKTNIQYNTHHGTGLLPPIINAILTTIVLALFQLNMYFFAHKWIFPSDSEIKYDVINDLKKYLN